MQWKEYNFNAVQNTKKYGLLPLFSSCFGFACYDYPGVHRVGALSGLDQQIEDLFRNKASSPFGRSKLMVVGEGRAGKTSTIKALMDKKFSISEKSTQGIEVVRIDVTDAWEMAKHGHLLEHLRHSLRRGQTNQFQDLVSKSIAAVRTMKKSPSKLSSDGRNVKSVRGNHKSGRRSDNIKSALEEESCASETRFKKPSVRLSKEEVKNYGEALIPLKEKGSFIGFTVWDFGGQLVFYTLHHMFLTQYGCYLIVFSMKRLLDDATRFQTLEYLKFWFFSKKLHAPAAKIFIVGTFLDEVSKEQLSEVDKVLKKEVLKKGHFKRVPNKKQNLSFFPVDNKSRVGIEHLKLRIREVIQKEDFIKKAVPVSFLRLLELLTKNNKKYVPKDEVINVGAECGLAGEHLEVALAFLNDRGLISYFSNHDILSKFIILDPQWVVDGVTSVIYDAESHPDPQYSDDYLNEFEKFKECRILEEVLLDDILTHRGYDEDVQAFIKTLMIKALLMCDYKFDDEKSFLVPALFTKELGAICQKMPSASAKLSDPEYSGAFFVIDFSGDYRSTASKMSRKSFVRYLPYGVFERLVCLAVTHSSSYTYKFNPEVKQDSATVSFGAELQLKFETVSNTMGERLWIKVSSKTGTSVESMRLAVRVFYSMVKSLEADFFSQSSQKSQLPITLLLPSSESTGYELASYDDLALIICGKGNANTEFIPTRTIKKTMKVKSYYCWFQPEVKNIDRPLTDPNKDFEDLYRADKALSSLQMPQLKPLKFGLMYHCFLSYKQQTAMELVAKQFYVLSLRGYRCWYDQQFKSDITLENMREGVKQSLCYILFLTKDVFPSRFIEEEVKTAVAYKKPILFLHHPQTGQYGYCKFADYIEKAPASIKPLFDKVESMQLQNRYFLEEAVNRRIDEKLRTFLRDQKDI